MSVLAMVLAGAAYYLAARLGLAFAVVQDTVTPLWPSTGIAVVAFLTFGYRVWPGIAAAAFAVNLPMADTPTVAAAIAVGNTIAPMVARGLLELAGFRRELDRTRDALALVVLAALGGMVLSATAGAASLVAFDVIPSSEFVPTWSVWWAGDAMGVLAVAPFLLSLRMIGYQRPIRWLRLIEGGLLLTATGGAAFLLRTNAESVWVLVFPLLGLIAWRFGQRGAAPAALLVVSIASWTAADQLGPFAGLDLTDMMIALQVFNATVALTSFFFASVVAERSRTAEALARSAAQLESAVFDRTFELQRTNRDLEIQIAERQEVEQELRTREGQLAEAQQVARLGSWEWDVASGEVTWSDELYLLYGLSPQSVPITYDSFLERVHPADRVTAVAAIERTLREGAPLDYQHRVILPDGSERTLAARARVVTDERGEPLRLVGTAQDVTERANAERALRESERLFRGVFETAAIGIAQCAPNGSIEHLNPSFLTLLDAEAAAVVGRSLADLIVEEDRPRFDDLFGRMRDGTLASFEIEVRLRRSARDPVWASATISLLTDTDGEPRLIQVLAQDLSERRRAEALSRAEEERARLRSMMALVPAAVVVMSGPEHRIDFANDAFERLAGGRALRGLPVREALPEVERQGYIERLDEVFSTGKPYAAEEARVELDDPANGEVRRGFFNFVFQPLRGPDGTVEGVLLHGVDVSEAVRSRLALSESLAFLDTLLATAPAGFAVFDEQFRYVRINERLADMNGRSVGEHIGLTPREVVPDHAEGIEAILERVLRERAPVLDVEVARLVRGGQTRHWLASYYPIESSDGVLLGIGAVTVDITERKRMEALLAAQKEILEVIARGTDLPSALQALTVIAEEQSDGDVRASILLLDPESGRLRHGAAPNLPARFNEAFDGLPVGEEAGSCGAAASAREPVFVADIATHPMWESLRHIALASNLRAAWSAPITATDGSVLGTFCMYCGVPRGPSPQEVRLLEVLTRTAAMAMERHRVEQSKRRLTERRQQVQRDRYEREHRIAETLQRSLLPERLPESIDVAIAARYIPASKDMEVGGDWYDIIQLPDGRMGLAIGDVAGHGINAAASMGQLRMALRAYTMDQLRPAEALARLNNLMHELQPGSMATLAYGHFDPERGELTMARAGHLPPLLAHDGRVDRIDEALGPPLGVLRGVVYSEAIIPIPTEGTLLLYTDGLVERRGESVEDGIGRLREAIAGMPEDLEAACDHVIEATLGGNVGDDTAVLAVRRLSLVGRPLRLAYPTRSVSLAPMRQVVRRWLRSNGMGEEEIQDIVLALSEASSNAIQHAYGHGEGTLSIDGAFRDGELVISVRDQGTWRPPRNERPADQRGRGLGIIRDTMDAVEIVSGRDGTELRMRRRGDELPVR